MTAESHSRRREGLPWACMTALLLSCAAAVALAAACGGDRRAAEPDDPAANEAASALQSNGSASDLPVLTLEYGGGES